MLPSLPPPPKEKRMVSVKLQLKLLDIFIFFWLDKVFAGHSFVTCAGLGNISAVLLLPVLVYSFHLGIVGAAIATIASQ